MIYHLQISSPIPSVPFSFVDCFLCSADFYLDEVPIVHFTFNSLAFGVLLSKKLLWLRSNRLLPVFSSRVLMVSCLTFRSFIHLEFIFVYGVRKWSSFILLHVAVQYSQHHLLKRLPFFPLDTLSCFVKYELTIKLWVHFWVFYIAQLIYVFVFVPVPYCLDDYSFII